MKRFFSLRSTQHAKSEYLLFPGQGSQFVGMGTVLLYTGIFGFEMTGAFID